MRLGGGRWREPERDRLMEEMNKENLTPNGELLSARGFLNAVP